MIVLPFISKHYGESDWSDFESQIIRKRLQAELNDEFISVIQVRLDDTPIFGFSDKFAFIDLREGKEDRFLELIIKKLGSMGLIVSGVVDTSTPWLADENIKYDINVIRKILLCDGQDQYNKLTFQDVLVGRQNLMEHLYLLAEAGYLKGASRRKPKDGVGYAISSVPSKFESEYRDKFLKLFSHTTKWNRFKSFTLKGRTKFTKSEMGFALRHIREVDGNFNKIQFIFDDDVEAHIETQFQLGNQCAINKKYEDAVLHFSNIINCNPQHAIAYHDRGVAKYFLNDYKGALADLEMVLQLDPKCPGISEKINRLKEYLAE